MLQYTARAGDSQSTTCPDNMIRLRTDLHRLWDSHLFTFVPKAGQWLAHFVQDTATAELTDNYHNLEIQELAGVPTILLLCRFALVVFTNSVFLMQNTDRKLILISEAGTTSVSNVSADRCRSLFSEARARSGSPKRSRLPDPNDEEFTGADSKESDLSPVNSEDEEGDDWETEAEMRGRSRKRYRSPSPPLGQEAKNSRLIF